MDDELVHCNATDIQGDSRVCHYDELAEATKERLPALLKSNGGATMPPIEVDFDGCDYVKYVEYYEIVRD
ncbi:hypothetical protein [Natrialba sp. PRR66]|uniref:hypothetical protein n=1 Tax=Natrialba sp. PRR66 TaxID=3098146 RepID=UPI002B1E46A9|nr:hypothetical protein [Natrialba sp. PRR66]